MRRAVILAPGLQDPISQYGWLLQFMDRGDSALRLARRQVAVDSTGTEPWENLSYRYLFVGMIDSAIAAGLRAQALDQDAASEPLLHAYLRAGRRKEALAMIDRLRDPMTRVYLRTTYLAFIGDSSGAKVSRDSTLALSPPDLPHATVIANYLAGSREAAIRALVRASKERQRALPFTLGVVYWPLKDDPRVEEVRRKVYGDRYPPRDPFVGKAR